MLQSHSLNIGILLLLFRFWFARITQTSAIYKIRPKLLFTFLKNKYRLIKKEIVITRSLQILDNKISN